jgi:hypothetical protein
MEDGIKAYIPEIKRLFDEEIKIWITLNLE